MNNTATNTATCPTVRKQIGKTTYIVRVHFSETAKETIERIRSGTRQQQFYKTKGKMIYGFLQQCY